jgi:UDP:flavonoid glycosyltransferase YjiC (YdhE family)
MVQSVQDGTSFTVGYPDTDARLEASLDLLEYQIARRLAYDPAPFPVLFRKFVRPRKHDCHRQVLDDAGVKIACRLLTWTCEVNDDQDVVYASGGTVPTGINALPQPLQMVAAALTAGSAAADIATAIAAALAPLTITPLAGIDGTLTVGGSKDASNTINTAINMTGTST